MQTEWAAKGMLFKKLLQQSAPELLQCLQNNCSSVNQSINRYLRSETQKRPRANRQKSAAACASQS